ncbi:hypothetical protein niasHT_027324 [Heterodera trifolii]|uniref:G-protein coupled receptors family 1 profile domain-containing protein n=1 Tax=Heterodera trifolii TaxID=157864 RepID=A0ABD2JTN4_9BILA
MVHSNVSELSTNVSVSDGILYIPFAISIFGLIGNLIAFLTIVLSDLKKNYVNIYLLVLLCSDSVLLLDFFLQPLFRFDVFNFLTCAMTEYFFNLPIYVSSFSMISLTAERFFSVVFPLQHLKYSQLNRWKLVFFWLIPLILFNFNLKFALKDTQNERVAILVQSSAEVNEKCAYDYDSSDAYLLFFWPRLFFTFLLPFAVVVFANVVIMLKIRSLNILQGSSAASAEVKCNNTVLFVIPIVFVLLNLPYNVRNILKFVLTSSDFNSEIYSKYFLLISNSLYLYCFNFAINFIIYALTSSMFRKALRRVWYEPIRRKMNGTNLQKVQPMVVTRLNPKTT